MYIMAINGSPNKNGNTAFMLNTALEAAGIAGARTALVQISEVLLELKNPFCLQCGSQCQAVCYKDTRLNDIFELMSRADGILLGSPVYFGTVSGQLKSFWDKTRLLRSRKALLNVVGGALTVGASRFGGQETTIRALHDMMLCQGMIVVGDGGPEDDPGHQGACFQKPSSDDAQGLKRAVILAKRVMDVAVATSELRQD